MERMGRGLLVDELSVYGVVDVDLILLGLPVGREHDDGLGLDLLGNLLSDILKDGVHGMFSLELDIRATVAEEVDGWSGHVG